MNTSLVGRAADTRAEPAPPPRFGIGVEGQRRADLGDGSFRNPVVGGDHPDPTVLKDGADYYLTFSSLQSCPGAVIWHSRDLVNWAPIAAALTQPLGTVRAPHLVKHQGRYFIYLCAQRGGRLAIHVSHADNMRGPWSDPVDLGLDGCTDPAHAVDEDGSRHLFVSGGRRIALTDDGLATRGALVRAHAEAPRLLRRGEFFYSLGATASGDGPPGSHVVKVARSPSLSGPWEACPFKLMDRTNGAADAWWTSGHANLVEGPAGDWWLVCHGHENGGRLGRQTLLQPVEWTRDGWCRVKGDQLDRPQRKPRRGAASPAGPALSDDFSSGRLGLQWSFFDAAPGELLRVRHDGAGLLLAAKGRSLADCSPLTCVLGDRSYVAELEFELIGAAQGGLALFHDARGFVGVGIGDGCMHTYSYGQEHRWMQQPVPGRHHRLRVTNHRHLVSFEHAIGDGPWVPSPWLKDVSALHQTVQDSFASLRLALFAAGEGEVRLRRFIYLGPGRDT
ncbi:family 43 glycosylhydrolase [Roseateles sp. LYH14W]|uniref:Family 43 glycosylhydrolase n=1 Tax=Pelomonas parva TaxID=3299032 RepID=A0ABW7FAX2_9BURK